MSVIRRATLPPVQDSAAAIVSLPSSSRAFSRASGATSSGSVGGGAAEVKRVSVASADVAGTANLAGEYSTAVRSDVRSTQEQVEIDRDVGQRLKRDRSALMKRLDVGAVRLA